MREEGETVPLVSELLKSLLIDGERCRPSGFGGVAVMLVRSLPSQSVLLNKCHVAAVAAAGVMCSFISIDGFQIHHVADDLY